MIAILHVCGAPKPLREKERFESRNTGSLALQVLPVDLYSASLLGHLDVVRELLARGADVEAMSEDGWTPLLAASFGGRVEVVRALLDAGANKWHVSNDGSATAHGVACYHYGASPRSRRAILALLAAAP